MKKQISSLQYITTSADLAEQACAGGIDWIQLRLKNVSYEDYKKEALAVQQVCKKYDAALIINDNVDLALEIGSDGVHVGKGDPLTPDHVASLLDRDFIIGCTANRIDDFVHLSGKAVDYIGLGPFRFTTTKQNLSPILGLEGYERIFREIEAHRLSPPPVIGIGGITQNDVPALMTTPLHGIAVSGAISSAKDLTTTAKIFKNLTKKTDKTITKTVIINAPTSQAWDALTNPEMMKLWLNDTEINVISDWKSGSPMFFNGTWHGNDYQDKGNILEFEPERLFRYNYWTKLSKYPDKPSNYFLIEFTLTPENNQTLLTLKQSNFILEATYAHWNYYWSIALDRLKKLIEKQNTA